MASEMVERVAKAMFERESSAPWALQVIGPTGGRPATWAEAMKLSPNSVDTYRANARAAIEAMREPTDAMVNAPPKPSLSNCNEHHYYVAWQAMIDAALRDSP